MKIAIWSLLILASPFIYFAGQYCAYLLLLAIWKIKNRSH